MKKITIEIKCEAEHCANCDDLTTGTQKGFCEMFWKHLEFERGKDYRRLPECLNAEVKE